MQHSEWALHFFTEHNDECDDLSKRGLLRDRVGFSIEMILGVESLPAYFCGAWDGAYNPGERHIGIG